MADVVYDAILGAGNNLRQVFAGNYEPDGRVIPGRMSGAVDPSQLYGGPAVPKSSFETGDLAGALGFIDVQSGLFISAGSIVVPAQKRANGGSFAGGLSHFSLTASNALIVPESLSDSQDNESPILSLMAYYLSTDGHINPCTPNSSQALAAQAFVSQFDFGPGYFDGSVIPEGVSWRINFGLTVEPRMYNGGIYPTRVYIRQRDPAIELTFEDFDQVASVFGSQYAVMTSCAFYCRKRADGASHVADATAQHIKISGGTGIARLGGLSAQGVAEGQATVLLRPKTLAASVASAIP